MKKIIFLTISLLLIIPTVEAKEIYYSEYSEFGEFQEEPLVNNELSDVVFETRYKFYKKERINEEYTELNKNYLFDMNDYIYTEYMDMPNEPINRDIEIMNEKTYYYQDMEDVRYVYFNDIYGSNEVLRIAEIKAFSNGIQIPYQFHCSGCRIESDIKVSDGKIQQNAAYVINGQTMYLDLLQNYTIDSLRIELYLYDITNEVKTYNMYITNVENGMPFYEKKFENNFQNDTLDTIFPFIHTYQSLDIKNPLWKERVISNQPISATDTRKVFVETKTKYRYKLYKKYELIDKYLDGYYVSYDGYIKDETQSKVYYKQRTRNKLEFEELKITDKNTIIDNLITSTTSYEIVGNIDYTKNGSYQIVIKTPYMDIDASVEIDIKENTIQEANDKQLQKEITKLEKEVTKQLKEITKLEKEINEQAEEISNKDQKIIELEQNNQEQRNSYEQIIKENSTNELIALEQLQATHNIEKSNYNSQIENYISKINELNNQINSDNEKYKKVVNEYKKSINEYQNEISKKTIKEKTVTSSFGSSKKDVILLIFVIIVLLIRNIRLKSKNM